MLIGAYGMFWERDYVDWDARGWRLLGRVGLNSGTLKIADFRRARGVYVLYGDLGVYYVGLAAKGSIGSRLRDHLSDEHDQGWTRFSWFSFDSPGAQPGRDGVLPVKTPGTIKLDTPVAIRDMEALLQHATHPSANVQQTRFARAQEWIQVATSQPELWQFKDLASRLRSP